VDPGPWVNGGVPAISAANLDGISDGITYAQELTPVGSGMLWFTNTAPTHYLLCRGQSLDTTVYAALFAVIGYTFGGSGASFNLPDLQQRFPLGKAAAGTGSTLGGTGGLIDHPHTFSDSGTTGNPTATESVDESNPTELVANNVHGHSFSVSGNTGTNNPPYQVVNFAVCYE
jgi:microcystin-dependent protein